MSVTTMAVFNVKFVDGRTMRRTSNRPYTHGWRVCANGIGDKTASDSGFSSSRELAEKAASAAASYLTRNGYEVYLQEVAEATRS